jgi:hypothetical protein
MPLPLSQVKPDATVTLWGPMLNPLIGLRVANVISLSARVDHELSLLLVHILGANAQAAHAMFDAIRSNQLKMQVLVAAANAELKSEPEKHLAFRAVLKASDIAQEDRNKIAHWVWGSAPELPDTLLLANPTYVRLQNVQQLRLSQNTESLAKFLSSGLANAEREEMDKLWEVDKDNVDVYTLQDLQGVVIKLVEATNVLFYFRYVLRPLKLNALAPEPPPIYQDLGTTDGALRQLSSLRLFQEALARVGNSKGPSSTPKSQT